MQETDLIYGWFKKADDDLRIAEQAIEKMYPKLLEIACFHCQQAAEKSLKGFLVSCGLEPPKTHNLIQLYQMCSKHDPTFISIQGACEELNLYSVVTRYPNSDEITEDDADIAMKEAKKVFAFCSALLRGFLQRPLRECD
jgi:HEPN domain-containing protein